MKRGFHPAAAGCLKSDILEEHPLTAVSELCVADGHAHMLPGRRAHRGQMPLPATVEFVYSRLVETTLPSQRLSAEEERAGTSVRIFGVDSSASTCTSAPVRCEEEVNILIRVSFGLNW